MSRATAAPTVAPQIAIAGLPQQTLEMWTPIETGAAMFANNLTTQALALAADAKLKDSERRSAFRKMVAELFDVKTISRALIGRERTKLDDSQLASYQAIVADYLVPIYATRIGEVCNTEASIVAVKGRPSGVFVRTAFATRAGGRPMLVDWLVSPQADGSYRALDVAINGVSLGQSKMDEFSSVIDKRGADKFLELLHAQTADVLPTPLSTAVEPIASITTTDAVQH